MHEQQESGGVLYGAMASWVVLLERNGQNPWAQKSIV